MDIKSSSDIDSFTLIIEEETSIINLFPYGYDLSKEDDFANLSQSSIDSSELVGDSDGEAEHIVEIFKFNKKLEKIDEKSSEVITV